MENLGSGAWSNLENYVDEKGFLLEVCMVTRDKTHLKIKNYGLTYK